MRYSRTMRANKTEIVEKLRTTVIREKNNSQRSRRNQMI